METTDAPIPTFLANGWPLLYAQLPPASAAAGRLANVSDMVPGGCVCASDGTSWRQLIGKRVETYNGTTDASGNYTVTYATAYSATPHVNPVTYPPADSTTRVRVTASTTTGFTLKTEKNGGVQVLGLDVLGLATVNVPNVPVRVLVVES